MELPEFKQRAIKILKQGASKVIEVNSPLHELVLECSNNGKPVSLHDKSAYTLIKLCKVVDFNYSLLTGKNLNLYVYFW